MPVRKLPKRFYDAVSLEEGDGIFALLLDGKSVRTPARAELALASERLAREIVSEWEGQGDRIDPATMPMTRRVNTALDRVRGRESEVADDIVSYAGSDLLCYRAESPEGLVAMQCAHWDPVLAWAVDELDAPFKTQAGISHVEQPAGSLAKVGEALGAYDFFALTPLHAVTALTGSALLALALARNYKSAEEVWAAAHVDEDWQVSQWGGDAEAQARRAVRRAEFDGDVKFLALVRS